MSITTNSSSDAILVIDDTVFILAEIVVEAAEQMPEAVPRACVDKSTGLSCALARFKKEKAAEVSLSIYIISVAVHV